MARLSEATVYQLAQKYFGDLGAKAPRMALEISRLETGGTFDTTAYNGRGNDNSYGLMQINMKGTLGPDRRQRFGLPNNEALYDPDTNMRVARGIYELAGKSWSPWTTSAAAAAVIVGVTPGGTDPPTPDPAYQTALAKIQSAIDSGKLPSGSATDYVQIIVNFRNGTGAYRIMADNAIAQAGLTAADINALVAGFHGDTISGGTGGGPGGVLGDAVSGVLDWGEAIGRFLGKLLDPQFWKRIGLGALAVLVILIGLALYNKEAIKELK